MFLYLNEAQKEEATARRLRPGCKFEYYLEKKALKLGYRICEVPVNKTYPNAKVVPYTEILPVTDWRKMLRPLVLPALGIRK